MSFYVEEKMYIRLRWKPHFTCTRGIEQAAVFGVPHAIMGELVQAAVTLRKDSNKCGEPGDANQGPGSRQGTGTGLHLHCDDPIEDITLHCRRRLSGYKVPTEVYVVTELPTNANGKSFEARVA